MELRLLRIFIVLPLFLLPPAQIFALTVEDNGYKLALDWRQQGSKFTVIGNLKKGKICEDLNVYLYMKNIKSGHVARINTSMNYHSKNGIGFKEKTKLKNLDYKMDNRDWQLQDLRIRCNQIPKRY